MCFMNTAMNMCLPESQPPLETATAVSRPGMSLREAPCRNCIMIEEFASKAWWPPPHGRWLGIGGLRA